MRNLIAIIYLIAILPWQPVRAMTDADRQDVPFRNWIKNSGFENGLSNWTVTTDTLTLTAGTSKQARGKSYLTWNSAGASRVLTHETVTVDEAMKGADVLCGFQITTASGTATHLVRIYDGTNVLASATVTSSTLPTWSYVTVPSPSSGTLQCQLISVAADEPSIDVTDSYMGRNYLISDVAQPVFVGSGYITGSGCAPARTSTTIGAFSTSAGCPGPTVSSNPGPGTLQTTDVDLPRFTFNSLPPGNYRAVATFYGYASTSGQSACFALYDGTTTSRNTCNVSAAASRGSAITVEALFTYTNTANISFEVYGAGASGAVNIDAANGPPTQDIVFTLYRFPSAPEQGFRPDIGPSSWAGYHDKTCSFARTNTSYGDPTADTTCVFTETLNRNFGTVTSYKSGSDFLPGIVFTPTRTGFYWVCWNLGFSQSNTNALSFRLYDGTTQISSYSTEGGASGARARTGSVCGMYNVTSIASKTLRIETKSSANSVTIDPHPTGGEISVEWQIMAMDFGMNVPLLLSKYAYNGSVTSTSCAGWTLTSTSYTDFAGDADCDLTATNNSNFGTVVSSGGATETPGLTFNPPIIGLYYVCVTPGILGSGAAGTALSVRLTDGTTQIAEADEDQPVVSYVENIPLCGIWNATSTASTTIKIQGKASTGSVSIRRDTAAQMFQWNIFKL